MVEIAEIDLLETIAAWIMGISFSIFVSIFFLWIAIKIIQHIAKMIDD